MMRRWLCLFVVAWVLIGCTSEGSHAPLETEVAYLPVVEMATAATSTPTLAPTATAHQTQTATPVSMSTSTLAPTLTPIPTWTPNAHPYMQHKRLQIETQHDLYAISGGDIGERVYVGVEPWLDTPGILPIERFNVLTQTVLTITKPFLAGIVIDSERDRVYVGSELYNNVITVFEGGERVSEVILKGSLVTMMIEPQKGWLYIATGGAGRGLMVLDGKDILFEDATWSFVPRHLVSDPHSDHVYMGGNFSNPDPNDARALGKIVVFDGLEKIAEFEDLGNSMMHGISGMVVHPDTGNLYAKTDGVYEDYNFYTIRGDEVIALHNTIVKDEEGNYLRDDGGSRMLIHPHSKKLYMLNSYTERVTIMSSTDIPVLEKAIQLPDFARDVVKMEADPITGNVYLLDPDADAIHVIHDEEVIGELRAENPGAMAVNPTNGFVYVIGTEDRVTDELYIYGWEDVAPTAVPDGK